MDQVPPCPKGVRGHHWWMSESHDALIGYYCQDCGLKDWHNDWKCLRADWLKWRCDVKFQHDYKPITFGTPLVKGGRIN